MNDTSASPFDRAAELRSAFDGSFARAPILDTVRDEDVLGIRLGASPYALRLSEIAGLFADKKITRVPSRAPGLLGIASFRGAIVPVYDLEALLGYHAVATPRWLVVAANSLIALAFETFEGHLRVPRDAIAPQDAADGSRTHVREIIVVQKTVRAVLDLPSVLELITRRVSQTGS